MTTVRFTDEKGIQVVLEVPARHDPFVLIEKAQQRLYPGEKSTYDAAFEQARKIQKMPIAEFKGKYS